MAIGYLQNMPPVTNLHDDGLEHAKQLTTSKKPGCFGDVALNWSYSCDAPYSILLMQQ